MEKIYNILNEITRQGFSAYLVGGCVRDNLLGKKPLDFDITTNARPEVLKLIFPDSRETGVEYGTISMILENYKVEITTFRNDGEYLDGRRPASVSFTNDLIADLSRRDFTINAMAMDSEGNLIDPFNGKKDIESKTIQTVGQADSRFSEDALRMLRAIRLSCQLGFEIEPNTLKAIKLNRKKIRNISRERITEEIIKTVNSKFVDYVAYMYTTELIHELSKTAREFDPASLKRVPPRYNYRLYAFINISSIGLSNLSLSKSISDNYYNYFMQIENNRVFLKDQLARISPESLIKILFFRSCYEDSDYYLVALEQVQDIIKYSEPYELKHLAINGDDLLASGISDGKEIGNILLQLLDLVKIHPEKNKKDILLSLVNK